MFDEGVRNAADMLRIVPFDAMSEFGPLASHAESFSAELAKAQLAPCTPSGQEIGQLLSAWRRRFSLLINMAHADNVLGGVAAERTARDGAPAPATVDDVMGVGEDPVGEDGMDIDAPAWPPAGVEPAMRA
eukprot:jgi/Tetstr1/450000/TSEL_037052.t1